jgi:hypothetical protein
VSIQVQPIWHGDFQVPNKRGNVSTLERILFICFSCHFAIFNNREERTLAFITHCTGFADTTQIEFGSALVMRVSEYQVSATVRTIFQCPGCKTLGISLNMVAFIKTMESLEKQLLGEATLHTRATHILAFIPPFQIVSKRVQEET